MKVASAQDIDLAMTKGVNYPKGLLKWADELGIENVVRELTALKDFYEEDRYRISPLLKQKFILKKTFY
jgi:3-hydroxybutyryl-CoA dehydrogenase